MTPQDIKTIDIQGKEWFDKVNGNSYFSALVTINFGMNDEKQVYVPMQYGYGDSYRNESLRQLQMDGILPNDEQYINKYLLDNDIIVRNSLQRKCLKRDVKAWGSN